MQIYSPHKLKKSGIFCNIRLAVPGEKNIPDSVITGWYKSVYEPTFTAQLHFRPEEVWLMPFGFPLDLWECHKQFMGISKPKREMCIDEVVPVGI